MGVFRCFHLNHSCKLLPVGFHVSHWKSEALKRDFMIPSALKKSDSYNWNSCSFVVDKDIFVAPKKKTKGPQKWTSAQQFVACVFFSHPAENQPERGESSFATTIGTAVSTSSGGFDSWIHSWIDCIDCCASSELKPETKKLVGEMCTSSVRTKHGVTICQCDVNVLPFLPDSSGHTWSSTHSSSFQRGLARHSRRLPLPTVRPRYAAEFPHSAPRTRHREWIQWSNNIECGRMPPLKKGRPSNACRKFQAPVASHLSELRAIWVHPKSLSVRSFHHALQDPKHLLRQKTMFSTCLDMAEDGWHMENHGDSTMAVLLPTKLAIKESSLCRPRNGRKL